MYKFLVEETTRWGVERALDRNLIFMTCLAQRIKGLLSSQRRLSFYVGNYGRLASQWSEYYADAAHRRQIFESVIAEARVTVSPNLECLDFTSR